MKKFPNLHFSQIPQKKVNVKIIKCGDTMQVYLFSKPYFINEKGFEKIEDNLILKENYKKDYKETLKEIDYKNILRSRNNLIRLILTNEKRFKSFVTLTFGNNITDISIASKEFHKFITKIKRTYPDFVYVGVPEFQKNGQVHYHLLTNIDYDTSQLLIENIETTRLYHNKTESQIEELKKRYSDIELLKTYSPKELNALPIVFRNNNGKIENCKCSYSKKDKCYKYFKTIKYWNIGFSNVVALNDINIVGYLSKYMIKDIDNRLFGHHRYLYGGKLNRPYEIYLDLDDNVDLKYFKDIYNNYNIKFNNSYKDNFGNDITFFELKL